MSSNLSDAMPGVIVFVVGVFVVVATRFRVKLDLKNHEIDSSFVAPYALPPTSFRSAHLGGGM
jgi:hypothetical protein